MKPIPAAITNYFSRHTRCTRCFGGGCYADPKQMADGKRVAISAQAVAMGEKTEPCPLCGANAKPK